MRSLRHSSIPTKLAGYSGQGGYFSSRRSRAPIRVLFCRDSHPFKRKSIRTVHAGSGCQGRSGEKIGVVSTALSGYSIRKGRFRGSIPGYTFPSKAGHPGMGLPIACFQQRSWINGFARSGIF